MYSIASKRMMNATMLRSSTMAAAPMRMFASNKLTDKEKGDEKVFFTREEEKTLKNLVKKIGIQNKATEKTPDDIARYQESLTKIFADHKLSADAHKAFFDAIIEWKRSI